MKMTNRILQLAALLLVALSAFAQATDYRDIKTPPLRNFNPPQAKRIQLDNGMVIFLMEDHELPLIRGLARIRGGGRDIPSSKAGMMAIYSQSWRTGGTKDKTGDQLDEMLESRAARVETTASDDSTTIRFDVLKNDLDFVFPIFLDLLHEPQFRQEKIDLAKTQANTGISRRNDDPQGIIGREATKLGYGADSPYARQPEYATIASITREDLLAFHDKYVHPNNIIVGVVGDFDSKAMEQKLRAAFAKWPRGPQAPPAPAGGTAAKPGVYFIAKDDVTQANIAMVTGSGLTRKSPDYYAVAVLNEILDGGSFSGRLMNDIRTKRGLAYGVGGGVGAPWDHPGLVRVQMSTKSGTTVESINALKQEMSDLRTQPFTAEEMATAKDLILNAFIFTMDSPEKVLGQQMNLEFYGMPLDYFRNYPANIQKVTAEQVANAAQKYVHPEQLALLVVGKDKEFDKPLSTLGTVTPIDITIPEPGGSKAQSSGPAVSNDEGRSLIEKVRNFVGGKDKIAAVKATHEVSTINTKGPQGDMTLDVDLTTVYPDRVHTVLHTPMGEMTMVMTPEASFMMSPMGSQDMPTAQRENMQRETRNDTLSILMNADKPGYTFSAVGSEKVGDVDAKVVEIHTDAGSLKWWIDPATGRLLRKASTVRTPAGPAEAVTDYSDWKMFGGLNLPTRFTSKRNGEAFGSGEVKTIEVNPVVDPAMFQKK